MADSLSWPLRIDLDPFSNRMETSLLDNQTIQQSLLWRKDINRPWRIKQKTLLRCSHCWRVWYTHVSLECSVGMLTEMCAGCYRNTGRRKSSVQGSERKLPRGWTWNCVWRDDTCLLCTTQSTMLKPPHQCYSVEGWLRYEGIVLMDGICASRQRLWRPAFSPAIIEHYDKILKSYTVVGDGRAREIRYQPRPKASLQASGEKSSPWSYDHYLVLKKTGDSRVYDLPDAGLSAWETNTKIGLWPLKNTEQKQTENSAGSNQGSMFTAHLIGNS